MKPSFLNGLAVLSLVAMSVGCASNGTIVRSQSPESSAEPGIKQVSLEYMHARLSHEQETQLHVQSMVPKYNNCPTCPPSQYGMASNCPTCPPGQGGYYGQYGEACPDCQQDDCNCNCDGMLCRMPWHPTHHHMFSYEQPKNLSYPTSQMGSLTRYPYYTFKGPDDFFHK